MNTLYKNKFGKKMIYNGNSILFFYGEADVLKLCYRGGKLERICTPGGYIAGGVRYHYVKDHQGNVRCVVRDDGTVVESNQYYPYGALMASPDNVQPRKYGAQPLARRSGRCNVGCKPVATSKATFGNEWCPLHGLNLYDSSARWYDPAIGRTTTMDPLAEKYPALSPYLWCAANPLRYTDERGDSIAVLSFQQDGWRHIALLIQDKDNKWRYFSVNGDVVWNESYGLLGLPKDDLGEKSFESPQEFLNSEYNSSGFFLNKKINCYGYDLAYVIGTTNEQDVKISKLFKEQSNKRYNVLNQNCATAVGKSIDSALNTSIKRKNLNVKFLPDNPQLLYKEIKKNITGKELKR